MADLNDVFDTLKVLKDYIPPGKTPVYPGPVTGQPEGKTDFDPGSGFGQTPPVPEPTLPAYKPPTGENLPVPTPPAPAIAPEVVPPAGPWSEGGPKLKPPTSEPTFWDKLKNLFPANSPMGALVGSKNVPENAPGNVNAPYGMSNALAVLARAIAPNSWGGRLGEGVLGLNQQNIENQLKSSDAAYRLAETEKIKSDLDLRKRNIALANFLSTVSPEDLAKYPVEVAAAKTQAGTEYDKNFTSVAPKMITSMGEGLTPEYAQKYLEGKNMAVAQAGAEVPIPMSPLERAEPDTVRRAAIQSAIANNDAWAMSQLVRGANELITIPGPGGKPVHIPSSMYPAWLKASNPQTNLPNKIKEFEMGKAMGIIPQDLNFMDYMTAGPLIYERSRKETFGVIPTQTPGVFFRRFGENGPQYVRTERDSNGNQVEVPLTTAEVMKMSLDYKEQIPTADLKTMEQAAPSVLHLVAQAKEDLKNAGELGPVVSRWRELWAGKVGTPDKEFTKLRTAVQLLQTRLMRMHVGARGGVEILNHFENLINSGKQSPENLMTALDAIEMYATEVGKPIEKQRETITKEKQTNKPTVSPEDLKTGSEYFKGEKGRGIPLTTTLDLLSQKGWGQTAILATAKTAGYSEQQIVDAWKNTETYKRSKEAKK